ncbi:MAG: homogentisate 1,2-dioxygenase [Legionellaceae bacterium]|nr:homogentisate 1,2-dioxygenase [Legionellaceae bacterium]
MQLSGFGNFHQSEALTGALPRQQNSPQHCAHGLYAEQLSGSAFTRPRHQNFHSWLYRRLPTVAHHDFRYHSAQLVFKVLDPLPPNPLRWGNLYQNTTPRDFIEGLFPVACTPHNSVYNYHCQKDMEHRYFNNQDGELLIIPYLGTLEVHTEFGPLTLMPGSIMIIPQGIYFKVNVANEEAAGYVCENRGNPLALPQLGLIGANGLANPRHFLYPQAAFEAAGENRATLIHKFQHHLWISKNNPTPLNVVGWQGNYAPCTYDLGLFNTINTVSFDHPDPSIFTVLSSESAYPGVANLDFVIFPARWMVAQHSFRPPYFHRNVMSELMGLISGQYDAKEEGFVPGGISIHNRMSAHGPDVQSTHKAQQEELKPHFFDGGLAFMLESKDCWQVHQDAYAHPCRQQDYTQCWQGFTPADT